MAPADSPSELFLNKAAAKHFVCMTFRRLSPGAEPKFLYASCFVVRIEAIWFLITAGHVITDIRKELDRGTTFDRFALQDRLAGNHFPFDVPIPFDIGQWIVFDTIDADIAAAPLPMLTVANLEQGGIVPIDEAAWGSPRFDDYDRLLVTGIPAESEEVVGGRRQLKLTILPLEKVEPPDGVVAIDTSAVEGAIAEDFPAQYGRVVVRPGLDKAYVSDMRGMSGSPVYGINAVDRGFKYWLIGIQSSWFEASRTVKFYPSLCFLAAFKDAIRQIEGLQDGGGGADHC